MNMNMKIVHRTVLTLIVCVAGIIICASVSAASEQINLKFSYWTPPQALPAAEGFVPWAKSIEEKTGGKVKITFFPAEALGHAPDHYSMVLKGLADIVWIDPNHTPGVFPLTEIISAPFLFPDSETCSTVMWRIYEKYLFDTAFNKVKVLFVFNVGLNEYHGNKEVKSLEDFKGMKLASVSAFHSKTYKALKASPVFMIEPEIYTALERGMVDGRFHNWEGAFVWKMAEVTKYRIQDLKINTMPNVILMNLDKWNSLPDDIKAIFNAESGEKISRHIGKAFDAAEITFKDMILETDKKAGRPEAYKLPKSERERMIQAVEPVIAEWVEKNENKGLPAKAMLSDVKEMVEQFK